MLSIQFILLLLLPILPSPGTYPSIATISRLSDLFSSGTNSYLLYILTFSGGPLLFVYIMYRLIRLYVLLLMHLLIQDL